MRAASHYQFTMVPQNLDDEAKRNIRKETKAFYIHVTLTSPVRQGGRDFFYLVAPFRVMSDFRFVQDGAGVLCESEVEKMETFNNLCARNKRHLVSFISSGVAVIG